MKNKNSIAQRFWTCVDKALAAQNRTISDLAASCNIPAQTLLQAHHDKFFNIRTSVLLKICNELNLSVNFLGFKGVNSDSLSLPIDFNVNDNNNLDVVSNLALGLSKTQQKAIFETCLSFFNSNMNSIKENAKTKKMAMIQQEKKDE